jgi:NAD+ kinase
MKNCLIIVNVFKDEASLLARDIRAYLATQGIAVVTLAFPVDVCASKLEATTVALAVPLTDPFNGKDFVITLGGDGTVLFAARACAPRGIPLFPINLGQFGFISTVSKAEWRPSLEQFLAGTLPLDKRTMVEVSLLNGDHKVFTANALNDIVVTAKHVKKIITLNVSPIGEVKADAVIVATATGSTAYSAAAGGAIIDPALDALILPPVSAFSLSTRPVVLAPDSVIDMEVRDSASPGCPALQILADGQSVAEVVDGSLKIRVQKSPYPIGIAGGTARHFYKALRSQMHWGE